MLSLNKKMNSKTEIEIIQTTLKTIQEKQIRMQSSSTNQRPSMEGIEIKFPSDFILKRFKKT